ncbi:MAG TPA: hypothetical protein VD816_03925 [Ohtaekwangia sp.]|nr:hypothetical protein [Ohtaekwangia sp.]
MNNILFRSYLKKAFLIVCLFLCPVLLPAQEWTFDGPTQKAYNLVLNLQIAEAQALIEQPETVHEHYVMALAEALELLITEDGARYSEYEDRFEARLDRKTRLNTPEDLFLQAEIGLQWAFVHLKFGHEFDAALNLRQAYRTTQEVKKRFPKFRAINKTAGLLDVIIGSVPEKYDWVLGLLNMEGSVTLGLEALESIRQSDHTLAFEADLLYALTQGFVLQQPETGLATVTERLRDNPANRLALFLGASLAIKNSASAEALKLLNTLEAQPAGLPLEYAHYLKGEVYLHRGEYLNSISSFRWFINHYKGQNYVKDAHYKIGLCYWLNGNTSDAQVLFRQARVMGKESSEADRYAARSLAETELPHVKLTKARYFTDGGYLAEASVLLAAITPAELPTKRDAVEFAYRNARVSHKLQDVKKASEYYQETIRLNGTEQWYFAPNACLQLGYLALEGNDRQAATLHFKKALEYKKHEYKNSIDSKAKSALAQLNKRR